ncbi:MAG: chemotaxis protein [Devosia sp.]|nr:chemotaxis protein [Devosia sp.]
MSIHTAPVPVAQRQLTVVIGGQSYGLAADAVLEVIRCPKVTRVPHGPPALVGVCNLRGKVLPVVSLARLMGTSAGSEDRVVVLEYNGSVGLLVDAVLKLDVDEKRSVAVQHLDFGKLLEAGFRRTTSQAFSMVAAPKTAVIAASVVRRVLVTFLVNGQTFALPLTAVTEVLRLPEEIIRVAGADRTVLGVANVRDRSLPIISLAGLLGFGGDQDKEHGGRVLVVEQAGARLGLVADTIESILRLDEAAIDAVPPILQEGGGSAELDAIGRPGAGRPLVSILSIPKLFANKSVGQAMAATDQEDNTVALEQENAGAQEQFVVFDLGDERYGLPIAAVNEVIRLPEQVTRLPNGPRFVTGIINLRGRPVPIIDQRQRFDAPPASGDMQPRVIIVTVGQLQAGFVVDAVSEILSVASADIIAAPPLSSERSAVFTRVANVGEGGTLVLLIDPQELLSRAEQDVIADIAAQPAAGAP